MATLKAVVLKTQERSDGTYPVSIRLTHHRQSCYIGTGLYVGKGGINSKTFEIKDRFIIESTNKIIGKYERAIHSIDYDVFVCMSCKELKNELMMESKVYDIVAFSDEYTMSVSSSRKDTYRMAIRYLRMVGGDVIDANSISVIMLDEMLRIMIMNGINQNTQRLYLQCIKTLLNAMKRKYNTEITNLIYRDPFLKFEIPSKVKARKRITTKDNVKEIIEVAMRGECKWQIASLAVSFLLCGTNIRDIVAMREDDFKGERIAYCRSKVRKRYDGGFISYKIEPELRAILDKYLIGNKHLFGVYDREGKDNILRYANGLVNSSAKIYFRDRDFTTYSIRRAWANIAFANCGATKDEIDMCLNHTGEYVDDLGYVDRVNDIIDRVNRSVIDFVLDKKR